MLVECINNMNGGLFLILGKQYELKEEDDRFYTVRNEKGVLCGYSKERFKIVEKMENKIVTCNTDIFPHSITKGKDYTVLKESDMGKIGNRSNNILYTITDNNGQEKEFHKDYFKIKDMSNKKIIGYKCPEPLYVGSVKVGTIYQKPTPEHSWYTPSGSVSHNNQIVPGEIVERWEPVYEIDSLKLDIEGMNLSIEEDGTINYSKESLYGGKHAGIAKIKEIQSILTKIIADGDKIGNINKYDVKVIIEKVRIGCETDGPVLGVGQLQFIVNEYNKYFKK